WMSSVFLAVAVYRLAAKMLETPAKEPSPCPLPAYRARVKRQAEACTTTAESRLKACATMGAQRGMVNSYSRPGRELLQIENCKSQVANLLPPSDQPDPQFSPTTLPAK